VPHRYFFLDITKRLKTRPQAKKINQIEHYPKFDFLKPARAPEKKKKFFLKRSCSILTNRTKFNFANDKKRTFEVDLIQQ
jgi:hypothetical protein